jgi:endonuclease YncB( thermonuclease family)
VPILDFKIGYRTRHAAPLADVVGRRPRTITGTVVEIAEDDRLTVLDAEKVQHKSCLHGIDAPEKAEPFGDKSPGFSFSTLTRALSVSRQKYVRSLASGVRRRRHFDSGARGASC